MADPALNIALVSLDAAISILQRYEEDARRDGTTYVDAAGEDPSDTIRRLRADVVEKVQTT